MIGALLQMIEALLMSPHSLAIGVGILVTALLGMLCSPFLELTVTSKIPDEFKTWRLAQKAGGGADLGLLERLLFFAAFWMDAHVVAGAWLAFKVAAKWAAWQHIAKLPDTLKDEDDRQYMAARFWLSSNLLGRFLNGTLYNIFCAGSGWLLGKTLLFNKIYLLHWVFGVFILVAILFLIGVPLIVFPLLDRERTEKLNGKLEKIWNGAKPSS
jgi:hypothetical protein